MQPDGWMSLECPPRRGLTFFGLVYDWRDETFGPFDEANRIVVYRVWRRRDGELEWEPVTRNVETG